MNKIIFNPRSKLKKNLFAKKSKYNFQNFLNFTISILKIKIYFSKINFFE
jgi:hypothetical protein